MIFSYQLPVERIAQRPLQPPEAAKLLVASSISISESTFAQLGEILRAGDLLVFNQTRVAPARVRGELKQRGGAAVEFLLIAQQTAARWRCLAKPLKKLDPGVQIVCGDDLIATIVERIGEKEILIDFTSQSAASTVAQLLEQHGEMPIPPYIRRGKADDQDRKDYQSIFAKHPGSIAAPTASLHFSERLMERLKAQGVLQAGLVLHLGTASFLPVYEPDRSPDLVAPGSERYLHSQALLRQIADVRKAGGRVFAVGTSVVRALESMARGSAAEGESCESSLFITPGFEFKALDGIITNFHQPGTTHLLLVEAFTGRERLEKIYDFALANEFRFLSYGDGMILLPQ